MKRSFPSRMRNGLFLLRIYSILIVFFLIRFKVEPIISENDAVYGIDDPDIVDIIIPWVNGSDPIWYNRMMKDAKKNDYPMRQSYSQERYEQHDEIKWALRSIERFAPWVNMIHIVTDNQYPDYIKHDHPKIHWVNHDTLFYYGFHSYSSDSILFSLINIPNISRRFIYMDDDFIFLNHISISDFFDESFRTKTYYSSDTMDIKGSMCFLANSPSQYFHSRLLAFQKINSIINLTQEIYDPHLPVPMDMSLLKQLESQIDISSFQYEQFRQCDAYHFESMYIQYSYGLNRSILLNDSDGKAFFNLYEMKLLYNGDQLPKLVCVNTYNPIYFNQFLPSIFPEKSTFEL